MSVSSWATPASILVGTVIVAVIVAVIVSVLCLTAHVSASRWLYPCGTGVSRRHIGKCPVLSVMGSDQR